MPNSFDIFWNIEKRDIRPWRLTIRHIKDYLPFCCKMTEIFIFTVLPGRTGRGGRIFDHDGSGDGRKGCSERISVVQSVLETGISPASSNPCFAAIYTGAKNQISLQNILGHQFYGMKTWQYANNQPAEYGESCSQALLDFLSLIFLL